MGSKGDLNSKNSHDSRWSNGSGEPGMVVGYTQFRSTMLFMRCMYITLNDMQPLANPLRAKMMTHTFM